MGSKQTHMLAAHSHSTNTYVAGGTANSAGTPGTYGGQTGSTGGAETRPINVSLHPRLHV